MNETTSHKQTKLWCVRELQNLELLHATGITTASARHTHETLTLGVIEQGRCVLSHKGESHPISSGSLVVINPDDVHACNVTTLTGYSQRIMYPSDQSNSFSSRPCVLSGGRIATSYLPNSTTDLASETIAHSRMDDCRCRTGDGLLPPEPSQQAFQALCGSNS